MNNVNQFLLPYQIAWLDDTSPIKIIEKSRRIGMTYVQALEDVMDTVTNKVPAVWFSSADESAAREYILYCHYWAKLLDVIAQDMGEIVLDKRGVKAHTIEFANGNRINALSSNPKGFRSKGGKVVLDEFAFHEDQDAMWAAAKPVITWGFPLRILSTHNGKQCRYYKFVEEAKKGRLKNWSLHTVDIYTAVKQGLADKILRKQLTDAEREEWIELQRQDCFDETTWQQEYCCIAIDEASAFLPYDLIYSCESDRTILESLSGVSGELYLGFDIARKKDLSVIWVDEMLGTVLYARKITELEKMPFAKQKEILFEILNHPKMMRACIDSTGLGMNLAEDAQTEYGEHMVEMVSFTSPVKSQLAGDLKIQLEDRAKIIPNTFAVREDFHSIRKFTTAAGNTRFDSVANEAGGHADRFWAAALATHAAKGMSPGGAEPPESESTSEIGSVFNKMM